MKVMLKYAVNDVEAGDEFQLFVIEIRTSNVGLKYTIVSG